MGVAYKSILWNRQKKIYDGILVGFVFLYLIFFISVTLITHPEVTEETLIIRSTATLALVLLHIILMIGPLTRLNSIFLPLLYNRRHLGVTMFFVAAIHGIFSIVQFHALGNINPILSVFISNTHFASLTKFPFQILGFLALLILLLMAVTSHDFWLHHLGARLWKTLHMFVYLAYTLIIFHVALGILQYETSPVLVILMGIGFVTIIVIHGIAGRKEFYGDRSSNQTTTKDGFIRVCSVADIPENRAMVVSTSNERIAIFKYDNKLSAVSNVCKHQLGPLGEGKIVDGCITCPWHGYQYLPGNGCSPPPFEEKVATFDVIVLDDDVYINPKAYPEGTERMPAYINTPKS